MLRSECDLITLSKILGIPLQIGAQNHLFGQLRNLMANLTAYIFGMKHDIDKQASALTITRGLLRRLKAT